MSASGAIMALNVGKSWVLNVSYVFCSIATSFSWSAASVRPVVFVGVPAAPASVAPTSSAIPSNHAAISAFFMIEPLHLVHCDQIDPGEHPSPSTKRRQGATAGGLRPSQIDV